MLPYLNFPLIGKLFVHFSNDWKNAGERFSHKATKAWSSIAATKCFFDRIDRIYVIK